MESKNLGRDPALAYMSRVGKRFASRYLRLSKFRKFNKNHKQFLKLNHRLQDDNES